MKSGEASVRELMFPEVPHAISAVESPLFPTGEIVEPKPCTAVVPWVAPQETPAFFGPLRAAIEYSLKQWEGWSRFWLSNQRRAVEAFSTELAMFNGFNRHHE